MSHIYICILQQVADDRKAQRRLDGFCDARNRISFCCVVVEGDKASQYREDIVAAHENDFPSTWIKYVYIYMLLNILTNI